VLRVQWELKELSGLKVQLANKVFKDVKASRALLELKAQLDLKVLPVLLVLKVSRALLELKAQLDLKVFKGL
jgi:hypothetical protein